MLTLKVESDGSPGDLQQIVSLAFNTGLTVVAELPDGTVATATPTQVLGDVGGEIPEEPTIPVKTAEVDEPHPVLEKEVPAEAPVEVVESTP